MTSCSLTRISGLLRVRVAGEGYASFYLILLISPRISMLSHMTHVLIHRFGEDGVPVMNEDAVGMINRNGFSGLLYRA